MSDILIFHILQRFQRVCVGVALLDLDSAGLHISSPSATAHNRSMPFMFSTRFVEKNRAALGRFWWEASSRREWSHTQRLCVVLPGHFEAIKQDVNNTQVCEGACHHSLRTADLGAVAWAKGRRN